MEHRFADSNTALSFILGGNAHLTIRSLKTSTRYTFRVKRAKDREVYFVSTLYGSSNISDYSYVGIIQEGVFKLTAKSRFNEESPQAKAFAWVYAFMKREGRLPHTAEVWHEGRCGCCGRKLTVPESIATGLGPECAKKSSRPSKIVY